MISLCEKLLPENGGVASLVGAGGKTTLMFRLARELADAGETVLTTTTTKIFPPTEEQSVAVVIAEESADALDKADDLLRTSLHVTIAREHLTSQGKLVGFAPHIIDEFRRSGLFRWIIVEADGAARRPLKAPAAHEPVIPECSDEVVAVVGLDAVGKPLNDQWVFRTGLYSQITGVPLNSPVTEQSIAQIILDKDGLMRGCPSAARRVAFLNKAERKSTLGAGRRIASILCAHNGGKPERIVVGSLLEESFFVKVYCPEVSEHGLKRSSDTTRTTPINEAYIEMS